MKTARQLAFNTSNRSLSVATIDVGDSPPRGLLARVTLAGVCGTDAHRFDGSVPSPAHPVAFGHEATGVVEALGAEIRHDWAGNSVTVGDRVTWFPNSSCYRCHGCLVLQNASLCENKTWPERAGRANAAGFQELAVLHGNVVFFRIPDECPDEAIAAFGCGLPTAIAAVQRAGQLTAVDTVLVQGSGPVGLAATLVAGHSAVRQVIVIGAPDNRLEWARRFGAHSVMNLQTTTIGERLEQVRELTKGRGADVIIEAAGHISAFQEGLGLLARQGRYVIAGLYSGQATVPFNPVDLNNRNQQLSGALSTSPRNKYEGILLATRYEREFQLSRFVSHRFSLAETGTAIELMRAGIATKSVVVPSSSLS